MIRSVAVVAIFLAGVPARADWQYTRWGMSEDQAIAASNGRLARCSHQICKGKTADTSVAKLFGDYRSGEFNFTAFLYFDKQSNRLSWVELKLLQPDLASNLIGALRGKYGQPASEDRSAISTLIVWWEQKDQIAFMAIGAGPQASVYVQYKPRITDSNKGL